MAEVTRLAVLEHAREIAEQKGAVKNGDLFFEDADGDPIAYCALELHPEARERVCGVCMAGAIFLAKLELGLPVTSPYSDLRRVEDVAVGLAPPAPADDSGYVYATTGAITAGGTPYVLAVLDRMIETERAKVPVTA
jgi:hypothetical protein